MPKGPHTPRIVKRHGIDKKNNKKMTEARHRACTF